MNAIVRRYEGGAEAAAAALGCRWSGGEGSGPCPACPDGGGVDRFTVRAHREGGARVLLSCRKECDLEARIEAVNRVLGPEPPDPAWRPEFVPGGADRRGSARKRGPRRPQDRSGRGNPTCATPRNPARSTALPAAPDPAKVDRARVLAEAAEAPDGTPAARYLVNRRCWRPPGIRFPPSVRWIEARRWPRVKGVPPLPRGAAGALAFLLTSHGTDELRAVSVEALTEAGERTAERWRRTFGVKAGARFVARDAAGGTAVLVEGEVDALAASVLLVRDDLVRAVLGAGGTAGLLPLALAEAPRRKALRLIPDPDPAGRTAALRAALAVRRAGFRLPDWRPWPDGDPAHVLAETIREAEAIRWNRDPEAADANPADVLAGAWMDFTPNGGLT